MPYKRDNSVSPERRLWSASPPPPGSANGAAGPSKKARTTVNDVQRRTLEKLLQNPNKEVALPGPFLEKPLEAPPDMVKNISGSVSGAGSGEFHVYKASRRREFERLKRMEQHNKDAEEHAAFKERQAAREAEAEAKTAKNRNKRLKRKQGRRGGAGAAGPGGAADGDGGGGGGKRKLANSAVAGLGHSAADEGELDEDEDGDAAPQGEKEEVAAPPPVAVVTHTVVHDDD